MSIVSRIQSRSHRTLFHEILWPLLLLFGFASSAGADLCTDNGCVMVEGGCWCVVAAGQTGAARCGYAPGYNGAYYSITGTQSQDGCENPADPTASGVCKAVAGTADKARALNIIAALGLTPSDYHCSNDNFCDNDCATNVTSGAFSWGTSLTCWDNAARWDRELTGMVRCTGFEDFGLCQADLASAESSLSQCESDLAVSEIALDACLADGDEDGVGDASDSCPGTAAGEEVDSDGCSADQFCALSGGRGRRGQKRCKAADWKNDEPLAKKPKDCKVKRKEPYCVAR